MESSSEKVRLDKWLWAARFFKTRSLATEAIEGGKVQVNQQRIKPSKEVRLGEEINVRMGAIEKTVIVRGLSKQRRPAVEAALLYEETLESVQKREEAAKLRQQAVGVRPIGTGRPTKKDRRLIRRFTEGGNAS